MRKVIIVGVSSSSSVMAKALAGLESAVTLAKAHVDSYTRKDGTFVKEHDDKRTKKAAAGGANHGKMHFTHRDSDGNTHHIGVKPGSDGKPRVWSAKAGDGEKVGTGTAMSLSNHMMLHSGSTAENAEKLKSAISEAYEKSGGSPDKVRDAIRSTTKVSAWNTHSHEKPDGGQLEAHGVKGMKSKPWRKAFKSQEHFEDWLEKNQGDVEVHGTRSLDD